MVAQVAALLCGAHPRQGRAGVGPLPARADDAAGLGRLAGVDRATARRVLGLAPGASRSEIDAAFRAQVRHAHPDRGGDAAAFRRLVDAQETLRRPPGRGGAPVLIVPSATLVREIVNGLLRYLEQRARPRRVE